MAMYDSNTIIKFADDMAVLGLITDWDEITYREEGRDLTVWCKNNNLYLNVSKTKELIVDYKKRRDEHALKHITFVFLRLAMIFRFPIFNTQLWYNFN